MYPYGRPPTTRQKVLVWIVFNVFFGVLSLGIEWYLKTQSISPDATAPRELVAYLLKKDLFLICTAIIADAFGGLILAMSSSQPRLMGKRLVLLCCSFIIGLFTILFFVSPPNSPAVTHLAWWLTFFVGLASKIYS